jgi:hypothetical protein
MKIKDCRGQYGLDPIDRSARQFTMQGVGTLRPALLHLNHLFPECEVRIV